MIEPALAAMGGAGELPPAMEEGVVAESLPNDPARMNVMPCAIERGDGAPRLRRVPYNGSADIVGPGMADGYFIVPRGIERVTEGERLRFFTM